jgi:hypothetical protein
MNRVTKSDEERVTRSLSKYIALGDHLRLVGSSTYSVIQ